MIEALKGIAVNRNSTLIVTIHQPSARLYDLFDKCLFLSGKKSGQRFRFSTCAHNLSVFIPLIFLRSHNTTVGGKVTYSGPAAGLQEYAAKIYLKASMGAPPVANAPEVFLQLCDMLIAEDQLDLTIVDTERKDSVANSISDLIVWDDDVTANSFSYETFILLGRNLKNIVRTKELFYVRSIACVIFGFLIGSLFYQLPEDDIGVAQRVGYAVFTVAFFNFTHLDSLPVFAAERQIFQREYGRGAYRAISYVTAVTIVFIPFLLVLVLLFSIPSYYLVMLPNEGGTFFFFVYTLLCTNLAAQSFTVLLSVMITDLQASHSVAGGIFSTMLLMSGFFITKDKIPVWWVWLHYISLLKYSYESFLINIFEKIATPSSTNLQVIMRFSLENISKWRGCGILLIFSLIYRTLFYFALMKYYNGRRRE